MQRKIAERCIRYFTKIGLSPASTTTLPLLDTKNGIDHVIRCAKLCREENATQNLRALRSLFHYWIQKSCKTVMIANPIIQSNHTPSADFYTTPVLHL